MALDDLDLAQRVYDDLGALGVREGDPTARRELVERLQQRGILEEWPLVAASLDSMGPEFRAGAAVRAITSDDVWDDRVRCERLRRERARGPTREAARSPWVRPVPTPDECASTVPGVTELMARQKLSFLDAIHAWRELYGQKAGTR